MQNSDASHRQPAPRVTDAAELRSVARELRRQVIRLVRPTGQGYVQQGLGAADLFAALYFGEMRLDPSDPSWADRDRFLLSTAHNTAIFHATLAARGCIASDTLFSYCKDGSPLEINASERLGPVIEATCGSLGQGLSVGVGMALAARRTGRDFRSYVVLGDGEMQEGQVWEAAMAAGSYGLGNLCLIIDFNEMQVEGHIDQVLKMNPVAEKWESFGFRCETIDGHDFDQIFAALKRSREAVDRPSCIIAKTVPGKGAPSLEGIFGHNIKLPGETAERALQELDAGEFA
ncbi:transketolase [Mangrovicella endophytica]|uniref:transketolase n=1 Tax=Mangrovicella endophytica TaxID=2066697 RepID=UPI0012FFF791|nr:transketolase [Mangrovicella endophytica]